MDSTGSLVVVEEFKDPSPNESDGQIKHFSDHDEELNSPSTFTLDASPPSKLKSIDNSSSLEEYISINTPEQHVGFLSSSQSDISEFTELGDGSQVEILINVGLPSDYMVFSLWAMLCCFWPVGIFALRKSILCRQQLTLANNDYAQELSDEAKDLGCLAFKIGLIVLACILTVIAMLAMYFRLQSDLLLLEEI